MPYLIGGLVLLLLFQALLLWRLWRTTSAIDDFATQVARVERGLELLTEASEAGFNSFGSVVLQAIEPARPGKAIKRPAAAGSFDSEWPRVDRSAFPAVVGPNEYLNLRGGSVRRDR